MLRQQYTIKCWTTVLWLLYPIPRQKSTLYRKIFSAIPSDRAFSRLFHDLRIQPQEIKRPREIEIPREEGDEDRGEIQIASPDQRGRRQP